MSRKIILDLETTGLDVKNCRLWCVCTKDVETGERNSFVFHETAPLGEKQRMLDYLETCRTIIGHNIINFDMRVLLHKFPETKELKASIVDTLILSRLFNFYRQYGHSVEAWGKSLGGEQKVENDVWDHWHPVILERCQSDVEIQEKIYHALTFEHSDLTNDGNSNFTYHKAMQIEHRFAQHMATQEAHGVLFDSVLAKRLEAHLLQKMQELDEALVGHLPPTVVRGKENYKIFVKNGSRAKDIIKYWEDLSGHVEGPFSKISFTTINMNSEKQVKQFLFDLGWKPTEWNYRKDKITGKVIEVNGRPEITTAKITLDSLESLKGVSGESLKLRFKVKHRLSQIQGLLENVREDGRVEARLNTLSAVTSRTTHRVVANIPKAAPNVYLGHEMRSLFIAPEGRKLVGCDASALEARIFAHYLNDYLFTDELLHADIHSTNQELWGLNTRDAAKGALYALIYGAGSKKLEQITGVSGSFIIEQFKAKWPNYGELKRKADQAGRRGYIRAIDGRRINVKYDYMALNYLIQSADSIIMKLALCLAMKEIKKLDLDCVPVINYHDEYMFEATEPHAEQCADIARQAIISAGEYFKLNCPLDGNPKIGTTWAEVH